MKTFVPRALCKPLYFLHTNLSNLVFINLTAELGCSMLDETETKAGAYKNGKVESPKGGGKGGD